MKTHLKKTVLSALFAAMIAAATLVVRIPSPTGGFTHPGDGMVLAAGWLLGPGWGALAAGIGSALADLIAGYAVYLPVTLVLKAAVAAVAAWLGGVLLRLKWAARPLAGLAAEGIMVVGYYLFEGFLYGFGGALANIPANLIQALIGLPVGLLIAAKCRKPLKHYLER